MLVSAVIFCATVHDDGKVHLGAWHITRITTHI